MNLSIGLISAGSGLIPIIVLRYNFRARNFINNTIIAYLSLCLLIDLKNIIFTISKLNSLAIDNLFFIVEMVLLGGIITSWLEGESLRKFSKIFLIGIGFLTGFYQFLMGINQTFLVLKIVCSFVLIILGFFYIFDNKDLYSSSNLSKTFFVVAVFFSFLAGSIILNFESYFHSKSNKQYWLIYLLIHSIINLVYNILIAFSIYKWKKK